MPNVTCVLPSTRPALSGNHAAELATFLKTHHDNETWVRRLPLKEAITTAYKEQDSEENIPGGFSVTARKVWRAVRDNTGVGWLFNQIERFKIRKPLRAAKAMHSGVDEATVRTYQKSLISSGVMSFDPSPVKGKKPVLFLILGNTQKLNTSPETAGINRLRERLKGDQNLDIITMTVGDQFWTDIPTRTIIPFLPWNRDSHSDVVYQHFLNTVKHATNSQGIFEDLDPTLVMFIGHSSGIGTAVRYVREGYETSDPKLPLVIGGACPIELGAKNLGLCIEEVPKNPDILQYVLITQRRSWLINSYGPIDGLVDWDILVNDHTSEHCDVDDKYRNIDLLEKVARLYGAAHTVNGQPHDVI